MKESKRFVSLKTKILISTLIPVIVSFLLISSVLFVVLSNSFQDAARAQFLQLAEKYSADFENKIRNATNYLTMTSSIIELQIQSGGTSREQMQKLVFYLFDSYGIIDGSSVYFEPNMYDGKDAKYVGSNYGSASSGRICYYYYHDDDITGYLPQAPNDDTEFDFPSYVLAKDANQAAYTGPVAYEIKGRQIPALTITHPIKNANRVFIGAVTVDVFLEELYTQLRNEKIYETGYMVITNDRGQVLYSPIFADIGKSSDDAGVHYILPIENEAAAFSYATSIINGKSCLVSTSPIYVPELDSYFYISVTAPINEINANSTQLMAGVVLFNFLIIIVIASLIYYRIDKISAPIKAITESANKIADGDVDGARNFAAGRRNVKTRDEVYRLSLAIKKMLLQLDEMQQLKLEALELEHKREKAEAAAQAKNDFLARMSHEIRTPMNAVMGMSELILRKKLPQDVYENALGIKTASTNLLLIINDILDLSKIESGRLEIIEMDYEFASLVNDVIGMIRVRLIEKPVQFAVNIDCSVPSVLKGDEVRIRQILINLLSNAVKYTKEGYILLTIMGKVKGDMVNLWISVEDSGIGIQKDNIEKLFRDFVQIDMMQNKGIEGTGLGLAITHNLCQAMGGNISVRSEYGKGSTFSVVLPQKISKETAFAQVTDAHEKAVLLYEPREVYEKAICWTFENLGVAYKSVENIPTLFENLENYEYVFMSSFVYSSIEPALLKLKKAPTLVLLTDVMETIAPKNARVLALPVHPLSVANSLNDVHESHGNTSANGASFIAPGAKVLIVDDIAANLKVTEGLMSPYQMKITVCMSGQEAIKLIQAGEYDLVFMDHMMPEMDGIEATRYIRAMEGERFQTLPIIALTANAVSGVREMFIQNGMNDFLAKPIETVKLDVALEKWIPKEKQEKVTIKKQVSNESAFIKMLKDVPWLSVERALNVVGGSAETYEQMIRLSIRLMPENIKRMEKLLDINLHDYGIEAHGVKAILNNIGAYALGDMAFELEKAAKLEDREACTGLHPPFIETLNSFTDIMASLIEEMTDFEKAPGDIALLRDALPKLENAIEFFDSALALEILLGIGKYTYGQTHDYMVAELARKFEDFDFEKATELIQKIKIQLEGITE